MSPPRGEITELLNAPAEDRGAADRLWEAVYPELRRRARHLVKGERTGHTLSATGVVNEAYIRLATQGARAWKDRSQFYAAASGIMREVLIDHARRRAAAKRGAGGPREPLDEDLFPALGDSAEDLAVAEEALERLAARHQRAALVVALRVFGGLSVAEVAADLKVAERTVKLDWLVARKHLQRILTP